MITNGFTYFATLVLIAGLLVGAQKLTKWKFFEYVPPVVLLYLIGMLGCTFKLWDTAATKEAYSALRNPILYAMIFVMLLRCDIRQILKLGPKMLLGFFTATITIAIGFVATYAIMHPLLGEGAWRGLGALCGSWMGGSGNLVAVADALQATEAQLAGASIVDSIDYSIWVMFLLWAITLAPKFNKWVKADTKVLDEVSTRLDAEFAQAKTKKVDFPSLIFLLGLALFVSAVCTNLGTALRNAAPSWLQIFDVATYRIVLVSIIGLVLRRLHRALQHHAVHGHRPHRLPRLLHGALRGGHGLVDRGGLRHPADSRPADAGRCQAVQARYVHQRRCLPGQHRRHGFRPHPGRFLLRLPGLRGRPHGPHGLRGRHLRRHRRWLPDVHLRLKAADKDARSFASGTNEQHDAMQVSFHLHRVI